MHRLRALNEKIILSGLKPSTDHPLDQRSLSTIPAEGSSQLSLHNVTAIDSQSPPSPREHSSPSASEGNR